MSMELLSTSLLLQSSCHCTSQGSSWHLLTLGRDVSSFSHSSVTFKAPLNYTDWMQNEKKCHVIMLTPDTVWEFFMIGPYSCLNTLFIPVCLARQLGLVSLRVDQMAGNSTTCFHLGSLNVFKMSDRAEWKEPSVITSFSASPSPGGTRRLNHF